MVYVFMGILVALLGFGLLVKFLPSSDPGIKLLGLLVVIGLSMLLSAILPLFGASPVEAGIYFTAWQATMGLCAIVGLLFQWKS